MKPRSLFLSVMTLVVLGCGDDTSTGNDSGSPGDSGGSDATRSADSSADGASGSDAASGRDGASDASSNRDASGDGGLGVGAPCDPLNDQCQTGLLCCPLGQAVLDGGSDFCTKPVKSGCPSVP